MEIAAIEDRVALAPRRVEHPLFQNLLIRHDWRLFRRRGLWTREVGLLAALGVVNTILCLVWVQHWGRKTGVTDSQAFCLYFIGFHLFLQVVAPLHALRRTRAADVRSHVEACLLTPIPPSHVFAWLWLRAFLFALLPVLVVYFPLYIAWPWLYAADLTTWEPTNQVLPRGSFHAGRELAPDLLLVALFALPWIHRKRVRVVVWVVGAALLAGLPIVDEVAQGSLSRWLDPWLHTRQGPPVLFFPSVAHFHPLVTLIYFIVTAAWGAALAVSLGLRSRLEFASAAWVIILLGPLAEIAALCIFVTREALTLIYPFFLIYAMLVFYSCSVGALWLALKWNLVFWLSRRPFASR